MSASGVEEGGSGADRERDSSSRVRREGVCGGGVGGGPARAEGLTNRPPARGRRWQHVAPGRLGLGGSSCAAVAGPHRRPNVLCTRALSGLPGKTAGEPTEAGARVS